MSEDGVADFVAMWAARDQEQRDAAKAYMDLVQGGNLETPAWVDYCTEQDQQRETPEPEPANEDSSSTNE